MQRWLKQQEQTQMKGNQTPAAKSGKDK